MTIVTKPIVSGNKDDKDKEALVKPDHVTVPVPASASNNTNSNADHVQLRRARRATCVSQACLLLAAGLALTVGFMGAVHLVRRMTSPRYTRGFCRIPYSALMDDSSFGDDSMISGDFRAEAVNNKDVEGLVPVYHPELVAERRGVVERFKSDGSVEVDYELDLDLEEFEQFEMPELSRGKYLHDFKVNKTAIVDPDGDRCFVAPLDRDQIPKPRNFLDILRNLRDGVYQLDLEEIRYDTRVVLPPVQDLSQFGYFIEHACMGKTTYELVPVEDDETEEDILIVKRSAIRPLEFKEFFGQKTLKYNIVNLADN